MTRPRLGITLPPAFMPWRLVDAPQPGSWYAQTPAALVADLEVIADLGVSLVRFELPWNLVQRFPPGRAAPDWTRVDLLVEGCARRGLEPVPVLLWSPPWAAPAPNKPPVDPGWFAAFAAHVARRYASRVGWLELWNEPNLERYWAGSLEEYAAGVLREGSGAVHRACPEVRVLMAGLAQGGGLGEVLAVERDAFDAANLHYYPPRTLSARRARPERAVAAFRRTLALCGRGDAPVWLSEVGGLACASRPRDGNPIVGRRGQVRLLDRALRSGADAVLWYTLRDHEVHEAAGPVKLTTWGLFDSAHRPRPAATALQVEAECPQKNPKAADSGS